MALGIGVCARVQLLVSEADTAAHLGSGDVPVLGTPRVVELCERATMLALRDHLPEGQTSVGLRVEITHLVPVLVGREVVATATLERTEGKRLVFNVSVTDKCGLVAAGKVTRVLVESGPFLEKAR